jgi:hypothetical protein
LQHKQIPIFEKVGCGEDSVRISFTLPSSFVMFHEDQPLPDMDSNIPEDPKTVVTALLGGFQSLEKNQVAFAKRVSAGIQRTMLEQKIHFKKLSAKMQQLQERSRELADLLAAAGGGGADDEVSAAAADKVEPDSSTEGSEPDSSTKGSETDSFTEGSEPEDLGEVEAGAVAGIGGLAFLGLAGGAFMVGAALGWSQARAKVAPPRPPLSGAARGGAGRRGAGAEDGGGRRLQGLRGRRQLGHYGQNRIQPMMTVPKDVSMDFFLEFPKCTFVLFFIETSLRGF